MLVLSCSTWKCFPFPWEPVPHHMWLLSAIVCNLFVFFLRWIQSFSNCYSLVLLHCYVDYIVGLRPAKVILRITDPTCHYVSYCDPLISHYSHCHPVIHGGLANVIHLTWERMSGWYFGVAESSWASSCQGVVAPVSQINLFLFQTICSPKCEHLYQNKCVL